MCTGAVLVSPSAFLTSPSTFSSQPRRISEQPQCAFGPAPVHFLVSPSALFGQPQYILWSAPAHCLATPSSLSGLPQYTFWFPGLASFRSPLSGFLGGGVQRHVRPRLLRRSVQPPRRAAGRRRVRVRSGMAAIGAGDPGAREEVVRQRRASKRHRQRKGVRGGVRQRRGMRLLRFQNRKFRLLLLFGGMLSLDPH